MGHQTPSRRRQVQQLQRTDDCHYRVIRNAEITLLEYRWTNDLCILGEHRPTIQLIDYKDDLFHDDVIVIDR